MQALRYFDIFNVQHHFFPNKHALGHLRAGKKITFHAQAVQSLVNNMACNLIDHGLKKGDYVCLFGQTTDSWWIIVELAISSAGGIIVPIETNPDNLDETIEHLKTTQSKYCFVFHSETLKYIERFQEQISSLKHVFHFDKQFVSPEKHHLFNNPSPESLITLESLKGIIHEDDLAFLMYTRGTTSKPKGILLSHKNILENAKAFLKLSPLSEEHRHLSITHIAHSFERVVITALVLCGASTFFQSGEENFYFATKRIKPHFLSMSTEECLNFMKKLTDNEALSSQAKNQIRTALKICGKNLDNFSLSFSDWFRIRIINLFLFRQWRKKLGNKIKAIYVIGSPLNSLAAKFFYLAGIEIKEGYGLTEATALVSLNGHTQNTYRAKTSGQVIPNLKVKIEEPNIKGIGEIFIKGPSVMRAYFSGIDEQPSFTMKEDWMSTGDLGYLSKDGFLTIIDRSEVQA